MIGVPVRYFPEASSAGFWTSVRYGLGIVWLLLRRPLHCHGLLRRMQFTCLAACYRRPG